MTSIRVVVADDHPLWRRGLCALLRAEADIEVVAEAADGVAALAAVRQHQPDLLLLDMEMPTLDGVGVTRALHAEASAVRILAVSAYDEPEYVSGLMDEGASGYITKEKPPGVLLEAVRAVAAGEGRWFVRTPQRPDQAVGLSARERDVLALLAQGRTNRAIGEGLFISENTVRNHLGSLYAKIGAANAREAVVWAWRHGLGVSEAGD